ncbi:MAG: hypothetical protein ABII82_06300 [Verrucomicrobiota bacterium]
MTLAEVIQRARAQDMGVRADQVGPTRGLLARMAAIEALLRRHRAVVDAEFRERGRGVVSSDEAPEGQVSLADYPKGFCGVIRDRMFDRLVADAEFRALAGRDVILKKVFVLLKGLYFQNALQLGNLYVDVANDTVDVRKPPVEWMPVEQADYRNADDWPAVAEVGRRYYGVELYPNFHFPLAFPAVPWLAVRSSGRIDFFFAQEHLFLKDLGDGLRRARALLEDPGFAERRLPEACRRLLERACGANLREAFPIEYAEVDAEMIRTKVLPEFEALGRAGDAAAAGVVEHYLKLVRAATARLARMDLRAGG